MLRHSFFLNEVEVLREGFVRKGGLNDVTNVSPRPEPPKSHHPINKQSLIYEVYAYNVDYYSPFSPIGTFSDFEASKEAALIHEEDALELHIDIMELIGNKFEVKESWKCDCPEKIWKLVD